MTRERERKSETETERGTVSQREREGERAMMMLMLRRQGTRWDRRRRRREQSLGHSTWLNRRQQINRQSFKRRQRHRQTSACSESQRHTVSGQTEGWELAVREHRALDDVAVGAADDRGRMAGWWWWWWWWEGGQEGKQRLQDASRTLRARGAAAGGCRFQRLRGSVSQQSWHWGEGNVIYSRQTKSNNLFGVNLALWVDGPPSSIRRGVGH